MTGMAPRQAEACVTGGAPKAVVVRVETPTPRRAVVARVETPAPRRVETLVGAGAEAPTRVETRETTAAIRVETRATAAVLRVETREGMVMAGAPLTLATRPRRPVVAAVGAMVGALGARVGALAALGARGAQGDQARQATNMHTLPNLPASGFIPPCLTARLSFAVIREMCR